MKAKLFYDSSSFVSATIDEVGKTLAHRFRAGGAVVFVFLGSVRATIIPMVAIPVSLIGTFAFLLAFGFSANTVSLLAMVLASASSSMTPSWWWRTSSGSWRRSRTCRRTEATKKAMRQITGPVIAISLVLLSVFVPVGFIPGLSGTLFRQFAVTISVAMLISAIIALTLSPALCGVFLRHTASPRGTMGWMLSGIDHVRDGYAASSAGCCGSRFFRCW